MIESKYLSIVICMLGSLCIVLKMYTGSNEFLILFLIIVSIGMIVDKNENRIEYLLFFISWVYVTKFNFGSFSLFVCLSLLYLILVIWTFVATRVTITYQMTLSFLFFIVYMVSISLINGGTIKTIVGFILNFIVIFFAISSVNRLALYKRYVYMYSLGIVTTCIVRLFSNFMPTVDYFIKNMMEINTVVISNSVYSRFSGLDLDPNYFGIQVLVAVTCLFVLLNYTNPLDKKIASLIIILILFGLLSLSKMFILSLIFLLFIGLLVLVKNNIWIALKYFIFILVILGIGIFTFFDHLYDLYWTRFFGLGTSTEAITTGRFGRWLIYLEEIEENVKILIFGSGLDTNLLNGLMAHNMYITIIFYFGIIGLLLSLVYFSSLYHGLKSNLLITEKTTFNLFSVNTLPLYILLFANNALDSFVMDFFPIHVLLILLSLTYYNLELPNDEQLRST